MTFTLALRNLVHDHVRFIVTLVGIVFSIVLVSVQLGIYNGTERTILGMLNHTDADLWIAARDAPSFDDSALLDGREEYAALSVAGVKSVETLVTVFGQWKRPNGGYTTTVLVGVPMDRAVLRPWNIIEGRVTDLRLSEAVMIDRSYFDDLGVSKIGATAEINGKPVRVVGITSGIRSFTTLPYVFMSIDDARKIRGVPSDRSTYVLVDLHDDADPVTVMAALQAKLPDVDVMTDTEFKARSIDHWLFETGAGTALIAGAILGIIVGMVIVAQTLYSSATEHINEFATLRALGSSSGYIHKVILWQAVLSAAIGFTIAISIALLVAHLARDSSLQIVVSYRLMGWLFLLTVVMCVVSALSAIVKVTRIDPAMVFTR